MNISEILIGIKNWAVGKLNNKQDKLLSGNNIKTINNESILGSGNINTIPSVATQSSDGLMSAADKTKLDGITDPIIAPDSGASQITLNAGTKYKLTVGGGSIIFTTPSNSSADIYWATYGISTYAEIRAALEAGKEVLMKYAVPPDEDEIWLFRAGWDTGQQDGIYFVATDGEDIIQTSISDANAWDAFNRYTYELQNNRVSTLSGNTSVINKYPNCKAVADYVKDVIDYPAGIYPFGTHSNIFVSNGNIVLWDKNAGSYSISLDAFYESYMKSIGAYNSTTASSLSTYDKIKQLAFMMANNCIIEVPAGSSNITKTLFTYMNITETAGSFVIDAFDYGASASGTRIRVTSGTVTITIV